MPNIPQPTLDSETQAYFLAEHTGREEEDNYPHSCQYYNLNTQMLIGVIRELTHQLALRYHMGIVGDIATDLFYSGIGEDEDGNDVDLSEYLQEHADRNVKKMHASLMRDLADDYLLNGKPRNTPQ